MDFDDTPQEAAFRREVAAWLAENAPREPARRRDMSLEEFVDKAKSWQAKKFDAGYAALTWPVELGGAGKTAIEAVIYNQEEAKYPVPNQAYEIGVGMILPTIASRGSEEQRNRFITKALRGEEIWCQMFSEPSAGSDLAAVDTRAIQHGDSWIVNGQKVWTSGAHFSDFALLLTRTDPTVPKHRGLTVFILDLRTPGVDIQPIDQLSGEADFSQTYLADVRIPDRLRLGASGEGWKVSLTTLMNERLTVLNSYPTLGAQNVLDIIRDLPGAGHSLLDLDEMRSRLVDAHILERGLELLKYRLLSQVSKGKDPGPEASLGKLLRSRHNQELMAFILESLGPVGSVMEDDGTHRLQDLYASYFVSSALRIGGGTEDIQKNIVAERILGLPSEPSVDRNLPFNELQRT